MQKLTFLVSGVLAALFTLSALCSAQTISIVSGNGQLVCPGCAGQSGSYAPLIVQVNDATGNPVADTTVTWTAAPAGYAPTTAASVTNSSGQATYAFEPPVFFGLSYLSATVSASALGNSVEFTETTASPTSSAGLLSVNLVPASAPPSLTGSAGTTAVTPIEVSATTLYGPLPGIQVKLSVTAGSTSVSCATQPGQQPGTVLTNSSGIASCTPVFGSTLGSGSYTVVVGGNYATFGPASLTVTPGVPALIKIISGNNQSVNPGVFAPVALVAEVSDLGGNPSSGATVRWSVTAGTATLSSEVTTSASNGQVSTRVTPTVGPVQIAVALAANSEVTAIFTLNVIVPVTGLTIVSGNSQIAGENQPFADPLIVQVNDNATPAAGAAVSFMVTSGTATLSAATSITNAQGQAQVTVTAGATPGPVAVVASVKSGSLTYSQIFDLTVSPQLPIILSITNAASYANQFISPCSLATIFGTNLTPGLQGIVAAFIEPQTEVANVSVQFNGIYAPILDVANVNGQESVSVQVPCEITVGSTGSAAVPMVVSVNNVASEASTVTVSQFSPGIFQTTMTDGVVRAVLVRPDGSFVSIDNPAHRGDTIRMFVTGLGQTSPPLFTDEFDPLVLVNGNLAPQSLPVTANVIVGVDNGGALVISAGYAYGMVGVYEVDFQVPESSATGNNIPLAILIYQGTNLVFGNPSLIPIE